MDFNKSTCVALKSTCEDFKIFVPGSKDYVRGRRFCATGSDFFSCSSGVILVLRSGIGRSVVEWASPRSAGSRIARGGSSTLLL